MNNCQFTYRHFSPLLVQLLDSLNLDVEQDYSDSQCRQFLILAAKKIGIRLSSYEEQALVDYCRQQKLTFGILQPLFENEQISDIIVAGFETISYQIGRYNYKSEIKFPSQSTYEAYVQKLLLASAGSCSNKNPIYDGMLGDYARINIVHNSIAVGGPYLTIRFNRFRSVSKFDLVKSGLAPLEIMEYLRSMVVAGASVLISGEVGTGKTTLLRALANEIDSREAILVIEDTPEIKLEHLMVRYLRTRVSNLEDCGRVSPADCIKAGMRMAMNRIVFGEIRDSEAAEGFVDVCSSGHPGLSTIHARSIKHAIVRMELLLGRVQRGVSEEVLRRQVASAIQVAVHLATCPQSKTRRIFDVREFGLVSDGVIKQNPIFTYKPDNHTIAWQVANRRTILSLASDLHSISEQLQKLPDIILARGCNYE